MIHEDSTQRVWNFTLKPGEMTTMHRHDFDYTFVVVKPSQLEVFGEDGNRLFDFWAEGTKAFRIKVSKFSLQLGPIHVNLSF